jgi:hypothetical protein
VTQSGNSVNIAPMIATGECGGTSFPLGQTTIDDNGALQNDSGTFNDPSCGSYSYNASGGFFGRDFRFSLNAASLTCLNINMTGVLSR